MKLQMIIRTTALISAGALAAAACARGSEDASGVPAAGDGDGVVVGEDDASGGDGDGDAATGDGDLGGAGSRTDLEAPLPMAVDGNYVPSGFMGDTTAVTITPSEDVPDGTCGGGRASGEPVGDCHIVTYVNDAASMNWGGVFWQYPDGNWGDFPGLVVAAGATKVTFQARGQAGGEAVSFLVGMEGTDTFSQVIDVSLTTEWVEYEIDMASVIYTEVFGGFGWTADGDRNGEDAHLTFYIDDIQWQ